MRSVHAPHILALIISSPLLFGLSASADCTTAGATPSSTTTPTRILVIGDAFADQSKFDAFVQQKICDGIDKVEPLAGRLEVKVHSTHTATSTLHLQCNTHIEDCWYDGRETLAEKISALSIAGDDTMANLVTWADLVLIVLGEAVPCGGGCTNGKFVVLPFEAAADILLHEMGHAIVGLLDEYGLPGNSLNKDDCLTWKNCGSEEIKPWSNIPGLQNAAFPECGLYKTGVFHATPACVMANNASHFCDACKPHFETAVLNRLFETVPSTFSCARKPAADQPREHSAFGVRVLINFQKTTARVVNVVPAAPEDLASQYLLGATILEVHDSVGKSILGMTSLNDPFLKARSYRLDKRQGEERREEIRVPVELSTISVVIPDWTTATFRDYLTKEKPWLTPHVTEIPDPGRFYVIGSDLIKELRNRLELGTESEIFRDPVSSDFIEMYDSRWLAFTEKRALMQFEMHLRPMKALSAK